MNEPANVSSLKMGAPVEVKQASIADHTWEKADGSTEGGESAAILTRREREGR